MLLFGLGLLLVAVSDLASQLIVKLADLLLLILSFLCAWFGWRIIVNKEPALRFGRNGIWTNKLGHVKWQDILLEFTRVTSGKAGSFNFLRITDKSTGRYLDSVVISELDKPIEEIEVSLRSCKKAQFKTKNGH
jgi:hypothetical protein